MKAQFGNVRGLMDQKYQQLEEKSVRRLIRRVGLENFRDCLTPGRRGTRMWSS